MKHYYRCGLLSVLIIIGCGSEQQWQRVVWETVPLTLDVNGELASSDTQLIHPPLIKRTWQFKIKEISPEGQRVKQGQLLISFDDQKLMERFNDNSNKLQTAKKNLENQTMQSEQKIQELKLSLAELNMKQLKAKQKTTLVGDFQSKNKTQTLEIELAMAQQEFILGEFRLKNEQQKSALNASINASEVQRLQTEVDHLNKEIKLLHVIAPKDGIVVYVPDHYGEKKVVGDSVYVGQNVLELPNLKKMIVKTSIPEHDASRVALGQRVNVTMDLTSEKNFSGKISLLGHVMRRKSKQEPTTVFDAEITLDNPDTLIMRPGMAVRLEIIENQIEHAIKLPLTAINYIDGKAFVDVKSLTGITPREVTVVAYQHGKAIITHGLKSGEQILL